MPDLTMEELISFLKYDLSNFIWEKIKNFEIIKEIELQFIINLFLQNKINEYRDSKFKIHNFYYFKDNQKIPDIVLFHNNFPTICFELKYYFFSNPIENDIIYDAKKLIEYFKIYPKTIRYGVLISIFSSSNEIFTSLNNKINSIVLNHSIQPLLINTKLFENYNKVYNENQIHMQLMQENFFKFNKILRNYF